MPKWTKEQSEAINKDNTNIIVSAGAGSGKTAVLSERVITKLKNGIHINELLLLTFTKAAAKEMKERIRKKIKENNLSEELDMIDASYITTFDSFALSIVKKYHYLLNVSKNVNVIEEDILKIKRKEMLDEIFENRYLNDDKFIKLINDFCVKDDKDIRNQILTISSKLDMLPNKKEYLEDYNYFNDDKINQNINNYILLLRKKIDCINNLLSELSDYVDSNYMEKLDLTNLLNSFDYESIKENVLIKLPMLPRNSLEEAKKVKEKLKKSLDEINELCIYENTLEIKNTILKTKDYVDVIISIILELEEKVHKFKFENDAYEFTDIALLAIKIVKENKSVREEIKNSFKEIMIDEYQDTNDLQEEFIKYIANNNVYMVGDIKQSIYRFRNANPNIFKNKYDSYSKNIDGYKIDLNKNFRSRKEVLDNINLIFNIIMNDFIGGADYHVSHQMVFGNDTYINEGKTNQDYNLDLIDYEEDKTYTKEEIECFIIANDIKEKIENKYQIFDKDKNLLRDVKYSDFVILLDRSSNFDLFKKIFEYQKIPLNILKDEKMNDDNDILVLNNLIKYILKIYNKEYDNYLFISLMRSFLYNEKDDVIFKYFVNKNFKESSLYNEALKITKLINNNSISSIIDEILYEFKFYEKLITIGNIDSSIIKIDKIKDMANNLSKLGYDIFDFSLHLDKMLKEKLDMKYKIESNFGDNVKIMTIHNSKGLEYHICYFVNLYKTFNISDLNERFLYNNKYGIVTPYFDNGISDTIYKKLVKEDYLQEEISEKIRLFYVALTRAKEKMILVLPKKEISYTKVDDSVKEKYRSFADIINSIKDKLEQYTKTIDLNDLNLSKDYNLIKVGNYQDNIEIIDDKIDIENINIENEKIENSSFSKKMNDLITKETKDNLNFGLEVHEILENIDFKEKFNIDNKLINDKVNKFLNSDLLKNINEAKIYKEYEFIYIKDGIKYHGIIDLMLEYDDHIDIIDYKLKNIDDKKYIEQLTGYKNFIEYKTNKKVNLYLYSIIDSNILEITH